MLKKILALALFAAYLGYAWLMLSVYPLYANHDASPIGAMAPVLWWSNTIAVTGATFAILRHLLQRRT